MERQNGRIQPRAGDLANALEASNRSLELNPEYVKSWINRGQILYSIAFRFEDLKKDQFSADPLYAAQLKAFDRAIELDPDNAEAWFNLGYALCDIKRYNEGIKAFEKVAILDPAYPHIEVRQT